MCTKKRKRKNTSSSHPSPRLSLRLHACLPLLLLLLLRLLHLLSPLTRDPQLSDRSVIKVKPVFLHANANRPTCTPSCICHPSCTSTFSCFWVDAPPPPSSATTGGSLQPSGCVFAATPHLSASAAAAAPRPLITTSLLHLHALWLAWSSQPSMSCEDQSSPPSAVN